MKNFALNHPFVAGFIIFLSVFFGGTVAGLILGIFIIARDNCNPSPVDPCDGGAMAAGFIWSLSFLTSLIAGVVTGILSSIIFKKKKAATISHHG